MSLTIDIQPGNVVSPEAMQLIRALSEELSIRYEEDDGGGNFDPADVQQPRSVFVMARLHGEAVGCGALRPMTHEIAEIKRMYVAPRARGLGIGRLILGELEEHGRRFRYRAIWLETGTRQPEAMRLYESAGYLRIPNYGQYRDHPLSVCYEKKLAML
jgi:GNAT superfamily N-acetyltransferase